MRGTEHWVVHLALDSFFEARDQVRCLETLLGRAQALARCLARYGERWERPSADEAVLVTRASNTKPGWVIDWGERLRQDIRTAATLEASIGIASTRLAARIASRLARPRGLVVLLPGYEASFISAVPLKELDELRASQLAALRRRRVRTLGELARLAPDEARSLLGPEGLKLLSLVRGAEGAALRARGGKGLERALAVLCGRLSARLGRRQLLARGLELRILYRDGVSPERSTLLFAPAGGRAELEARALNLLRFVPFREPEVVSLSLTATGLAPRPDQLALFTGLPPEREIQVRLGRLPA